MNIHEADRLRQVFMGMGGELLRLKRITKDPDVPETRILEVEGRLHAYLDRAEKLVNSSIRTKGENVLLCECLARYLHRNQLDKQGRPYSEHLETVANELEKKGYPSHVIGAGWLHDSIEDCGITGKMLSYFVPMEVVHLVRCVTKGEMESYSSYIDRVACNPEAIAVKIADLKHNMNPRRGAIPGNLRERYEQAMQKLSPGWRLYRALIRVDRIEGEEAIAYVPSWNPHEVVRFFLNLVPEELRVSIGPGSYLIAHVNIGAECAEDLYYTSFEEAPALPEAAWQQP